PLTWTGVVTSCPPRRRGVIIGPQQPGAVLAMIVPPFSTGPSIGASGSRVLFVNSDTTTLRRVETVLPSGMIPSPDLRDGFESKPRRPDCKRIQAAVGAGRSGQGW